MRCRRRAARRRGVPPARMMRRSIRVGDASRMSSSSPRTRKRSPGLGIRPAHSTIRPATVVDRPAGSATPKRSSIASGDRLPSVSKTVGPAGGLGAHLLVVLVEDLAHQLLQQVFERRDAEGAAELVEHHGEVPPLALHVEQQVAAGCGWPASPPRGAPAADRPAAA